MGSKVEPRYMLDTCICIYAMKGNKKVIDEWTKHEPEEICISLVTYGELRFGVENSSRREENLAKLQRFLEGVRILELDAATMDEYARLRAALKRQGTPIGDHDVLIAAQANSLDLTLVTHNVREFVRVPGLEVADWV